MQVKIMLIKVERMIVRNIYLLTVVIILITEDTDDDNSNDGNDKIDIFNK